MTQNQCIWKNESSCDYDDPRRTCLKLALFVMWAIGSGHLDLEIGKLMQKWIKRIVLCTQIDLITCHSPVQCSTYHYPTRR